MKMQSLSLLLFLAIALVVTQSTQTETVARDMDLKAFSRSEDQQARAEAVVRNRRGANGGSDLTTKPSQDKNGAVDLPVPVGVSMVVTCFFFLLQL